MLYRRIFKNLFKYAKCIMSLKLLFKNLLLLVCLQLKTGPIRHKTSFLHFFHSTCVLGVLRKNEGNYTV